MRKRLTLLLATSLVLTAVIVPAASAKETNHADYWADTLATHCVKYDTEMGQTWASDGNYGWVIVKAGRGSFVLEDIELGEEVESPNGKDISHIIVCLNSWDADI